MIANNLIGYMASWDYGDSNAGYIKEVEDDLWMFEDRRNWRNHLKILWLGVLKLKQCFASAQHLNHRLYYRRLLISISGGLARKGYNKKN